MIDCPTQFFGRGIARPGGDFVPRQIMLGHLAMIDREIGVAMFEIGHGIAPRVHHIGQQPVGPADGLYRAVDEQRLGFGPVGSVAIALGGGQRTDLEFRDALPAFDQVGFGIATLAAHFDRAVVFLTEGIA